ncbi:MAG: translation initiation factor IF-3 [Omnitrophica WOR_2 bacterium GWF2_38_59]|nr:MAG: translation initiation factor IF-3 [Omnitrophica WOR_2 bacterium GWF2_38_59]OGX49938.1 MAG: translation initiation factor IF-3 [Omnitrophica WOR_2 bacterium RIFOXYA2_FULL_38_17]OGX53698.1 MAG: translation initiation factor IF-3 [Omnitrophica WOR_2 bacterium RIFOXYA12_FULL_38_10]OGX56549.1 MAG: translation initiation factor IF-3 [Omnitrophica WOR_2 bacterium RIFOXYB2_FULL_38_16]OGX58127.1 MAG: translation initiation factor IF-3 [Omnitrophica WOR_2 bacterium RIFOXYC2_FULL_38_12]
MQKFIRINERIRASEVRVIGPDGEQLGVVVIKRAIDLAKEHELDLVEIAPTAKPPVCRIMDYSKYKYDQEKKERKVKKNQHVTHLKQIRLKPHIGESDYQIKLKQAIGFLGKKDKVKINMMFRGRELMHRDLGKDIVERMVVDMKEHGTPESAPSMEGKTMYVVLNPNADK